MARSASTSAAVARAKMRVDRADLERDAEALDVGEGLAADVREVEGEELEGAGHPVVGDGGADLRADLDQAVGLEDSHGLADGVAAGREALAELALGRQAVADPEAAGGDDAADLGDHGVDGRAAQLLRQGGVVLPHGSWRPFCWTRSCLRRLRLSIARCVVGQMGGSEAPEAGLGELDRVAGRVADVERAGVGAGPAEVGLDGDAGGGKALRAIGRFRRRWRRRRGGRGRGRRGAGPGGRGRSGAWRSRRG